MSRFSSSSAARLLATLCTLLLACLAFVPVAHADDDFLPPEQAFKFSAHMADAHTIVVNYAIADGYYMYRERFHFSANGAKLGEPAIPPGKVKFDDTFQKNVETYHNGVEIRIPVEATGPFTLNASGQGCADKGLCYPPQDTSIQLAPGGGGEPQMSVAPAQSLPPGQSTFAFPGQAAQPAPQVDTPAASSPTAAPAAAAQPLAPAPARGAPSELSGIAALLQGGRLLAIVPAFILLGLGLAFTPCVLPMVPILSSIIVGEGPGVRRARGFLLSLAYSLGMAIVYTSLGIAAGLIGEGLSAALQNPWVLGTFGLLMVGMALSMFGFYELQLPAALQTRLSVASGRQSSGKAAGVFIMGAISALIVGPCVAAPLAGALVYISHTRNVVVGGTALFSMAMGMSIPLLLVGLSAGALLPRAGRWMEGVKRFFGVLMLAMALYLVSPVLPATVQMAGWAALLVGYGAWLVQGRVKWPSLAWGVVLIVLGAVELVGLASGARDPLAPLAEMRGARAHGLAFQRIRTSAELDTELARLNGKTAMLDFYADWCVSCKEMEKLTFTDARVQSALENTVRLQIDVTANNADDKAMLKRFGLFGPPGIILFDSAGREIPGSRVVGYQDTGKFLTSLRRLRAPG
jgi:thiol:disulfide interchange protein DsbD